MPSRPLYAESELVNLLKKKDQQAYNYLYDNYAAALFGVIVRTVSAEETARDILQDVFVKIWSNIDSYDSQRGKLFTWMINIARNSAIDALRSKSYKQEKKNLELNNDVHVNDIHLSLSPNVDHIGLDKILQQLKEEQRIIIDLAYFKGYTQEEIAKELQMPLGTVKTRIRNALIQLKNIFQK